MPRTPKPKLTKIAVIALLSLGIALTLLSGFYVSSFLAILGVAIVFWGAILLYMTPTRHVPLTFLNVAFDAGNTERILKELNFNLKGVYLPPKNLKNIESSMVFIPEKQKAFLPDANEAADKLLTKRKNGVLLTPPGAALCKLFEQEIGTSFTKTDLTNLQTKLPTLLVEDMELAENAEIQISGVNVTVNVTGSILDGICQEMENYPRTHVQVGCLLSSAIACAIAKAAGEPVIILKENRNLKTKTTQIQYQILQVQPVLTNLTTRAKTAASAKTPEASPISTVPESYTEVAVIRSPGSKPTHFNPLTAFAAILLVVVIVNISAWFVGWRLYSSLSIWQALLNYEYQNLLIVIMASTSAAILVASGFTMILSGSKAFNIAKNLGVVICLDITAWSLGWLLYEKLSKMMTINYYLFLLTIVLSMTFISAAILAMHPKAWYSFKPESKQTAEQNDETSHSRKEE